jgi:hypothetical protein
MFPIDGEIVLSNVVILKVHLEANREVEALQEEFRGNSEEGKYKCMMNY